MFDRFDVVRFRAPLPDEDDTERYMVIEPRGERTLVVAVSTRHWKIRPLHNFPTSDLEIVSE